jgi:hypothetical protein
MISDLFSYHPTFMRRRHRADFAPPPEDTVATLDKTSTAINNFGILHGYMVPVKRSEEGCDTGNAWVNDYLHFGNFATSRSEGAHGMIKRDPMITIRDQ